MKATFESTNHEGKLPYLTADLPGIDGIVRVSPEDFVVEEHPL